VTLDAEVEDLLKPVVAGSRRILTIDIERRPGTAYFYDAKVDWIPARNVVEYPRTVCFAARWYGHPNPIFSAEWHKAGHDGMVHRAWELFDEADIVYTYNGKKFDEKHLRGDWAVLGLPPPRPWKSVDLLSAVRANFAWEHKSLDAVTRRLGRPGKEHPFDLQMILDASDGNRQAQSDMRIYNIGDIELTEWLADRLRPYLHNHPFPGSFGGEVRCNTCGSDKLTLQPSRYLAVVIERALYRCDDCGGNVSGGWHARAAATRGVR
jgi:hypothetical protein